MTATARAPEQVPPLAPQLRVVDAKPPGMARDLDSSYTHYLDPAFPLEHRVQAAFNELEVDPKDQADIRSALSMLATKHPPTYRHCLRVGLLSASIARFEQLDARAALMAGLLHDCGKALASLELLTKTNGWTKEDSGRMQQHVDDGYRLIKDRFDFSADVLLWHHRFQRDSYPVTLPTTLHEYSNGTQTLIARLGRVLALADCFDALHRINDHSGVLKRMSGTEIKERMLTWNIDQKVLIGELYRVGTLTTFLYGEPDEETAEVDRDDELHAASFKYTDTDRSPRNTRRNLATATALSALPEKPGCTSRYSNASRHLRLEYFVAAGINISDAFEDLAAALAGKTEIPANLYEFGSRAQLESKRNRRGGRVNQAMIEMLVPIVTAQHLADPQYKLTPNEVLDRATEVLHRTERVHVEDLRALKILAHELSKYDRAVPEHERAQSVFEFYEAELKHSEQVSSVAHNREFVEGFPTVRMMQSVLENCPYPELSRRLEEAFHRARYEHDPDVSAGFLGDCSTIALYLRLSQNPTARIVG